MAAALSMPPRVRRRGRRSGNVVRGEPRVTWGASLPFQQGDPLGLGRQHGLLLAEHCLLLTEPRAQFLDHPVYLVIGRHYPSPSVRVVIA